MIAACCHDSFCVSVKFSSIAKDTSRIGIDVTHDSDLVRLLDTVPPVDADGVDPEKSRLGRVPEGA